MSFSKALILSSLMITSAAVAQETPNLLDTAISEASTSLQEGTDPKPKASKKKLNQQPESVPSIDTQQISILRLEDTYETPRARSYDFRSDLTLETLRLQGFAPDSFLGDYEVSQAGAIPMLTLRFGFLVPVYKQFSAGLTAFGGYGLRPYNIEPEGSSAISSRLNIIGYGLAGQGRWNFTPRLYSELSYEQGQLGIRQSSSESTLAQWSENASTRVTRLGLGYLVDSRWEMAAHIQQRTLASDRFSLDSNQWALSTGVKW